MRHSARFDHFENSSAQTVTLPVRPDRIGHPVLGIVTARAGSALRLNVFDQIPRSIILHLVTATAVAVDIGQSNQPIVGAVDFEAGIGDARHVRRADQPIAEAVITVLLVEGRVIGGPAALVTLSAFLSLGQSSAGLRFRNHRMRRQRFSRH